MAVLTFFNTHEARTVEALSARIIPGDRDDPGAREAGAVTYIDQALSGAYSDLQNLYHKGITELDGYAVDLKGKRFAQLDGEQQDAVLTTLDDVVASGLSEHGASAPSASDPLVVAALEPAADDRKEGLAYFFAVVREHVIEGTFCDPVHGGNRDLVGWKMVGFPGAQWEYTKEQRRLGFDATAIPMMTLADIQRDPRARSAEPSGHVGS